MLLSPLLAEVHLLGFEICYHFKYQFGLCSAKFLHNVFKLLLGGEVIYGILSTFVTYVMYVYLQ